jgi:Zn-dependent protease with chaperone function
MDFFGQQERARRNTRLLVFLYCVAVVLIVAAVYLAVTLIFLQTRASGQRPPDAGLEALWDPARFLWVAVGTLAVVSLGTAYRIQSLSGGGEAVARMLGGRPVDPGTPDPAERRLLNIVEEMALASGTPVPRIFLLEEEDSINAFAAGFGSADAVVAVTRGAMRLLSRDELQGVIAHEFSHIFNGDMRLNLRLMGVLYGILVIAMIGYWTLRVTSRSSGRRSSSEKKGGNPLPLLGLALMIIGYVGVFFAKLIKSAVSREREFLADASSVQFTRNPAGLAGALKKIGGIMVGSRLRCVNAEEASHFYFANGIGASLLGLMATHPPLAERIRRVDPSFNGEFPKVPGAVSAVEAEAAGGAAAAVPFARPGPAPRFAVNARQVIASVGSPGFEHLRSAAGLIAALPPELVQAVRHRAGAMAVLYGLLLSQNPAVREIQMRRLNDQAEPGTLDEMKLLGTFVAALPVEARLPLVDLSLPALRALGRDRCLRFRKTLEEMVMADEQVDLFEYTLHHVLRRHLDPVVGDVQRKAAQYYALKPLIEPCVKLLSALARIGAGDETAATRAFAAGFAELGAGSPAAIATRSECSLGAVDAALEILSLAMPAIKKRILTACVACVAADGQLTRSEAELLRAVADALDCPLPPFLGGADAAASSPAHTSA